MNTPSLFSRAALKLVCFLLDFFQEDSKRKDSSFVGRLTRDFYISEAKRNAAQKLSKQFTAYYNEELQNTTFLLPEGALEGKKKDQYLCNKLKHALRKTVKKSPYQHATFETTLLHCEKAIDRLLELFEELELTGTPFIPQRRSSYKAINHMFFYIIENENKLFSYHSMFDYMPNILMSCSLLVSYKHYLVNNPAEEKKRLALETAKEIAKYFKQPLSLVDESAGIAQGLKSIENTLRLNKELGCNPGRLKKHLEEAQSAFTKHQDEYDDFLYESPTEKQQPSLVSDPPKITRRHSFG
jgi:hypothetical protein